MPEAKDLHVDAVLTDFSVKYRNEEMIWPYVLPVVKVNRRSDKFEVYEKSDAFRLPDDMLGPVAMPNEIDWKVTPDNYSVEDHGLGKWLAQEAVENADAPIKPELDTVEKLNEQLDVAQEKRVVDLAFVAGSYPSGNKVTLAGNDQWGGTTDNPLANLLTAIETCFYRANTIVMGVETWLVFRRLPEILDAVKGSTRYQSSPGGLATAEECKGLFEVENWLIGRSKYVTSKKGQTATYARLWGKHVAALHVVKSPGINTVAFGVTFCEMLREAQRDFDKKRGAKGAHYFKVAWNSDEKIIASDLGYFIENAVP